MLPIRHIRRMLGGGPAHGVLDDLAHVLVEIGRECFVAGAEIKNLSGAALPGAAAAENLTAAKPADEDQLVGLGNVEVLAVHFFVFEHKMVVESLRDRM